jgi:hypothetical protein
MGQAVLAAPSVALPALHFMHRSLPAAAVKVPGAHGVQLLWPLTLKWPGKQVLQVLAPGAAKVPARQVTHLPSRPSVPAGQASHEVEVAERAEPGAQGLQPEAEPSARVVPSGQLPQKPAPLVLYVLKPQVTHVCVPPTAYLPAAHSRHFTAAAGATRPARQSKHFVAAGLGAWRPGTHAVHAMVAFSLVAKPAAHGRQAPPVAE